MKYLSTAAILVAAFLCANSALAQTNAGMITGQVADATGAAIPGAEVVLTDAQTGVRTTVTSEGNGNFIYPSVQPGKYTITVQANGFKRLERKDLTLSSTERLSVGT